MLAGFFRKVELSVTNRKLDRSLRRTILSFDNATQGYKDIP